MNYGRVVRETNKKEQRMCYSIRHLLLNTHNAFRTHEVPFQCRGSNMHTFMEMEGAVVASQETMPTWNPHGFHMGQSAENIWSYHMNANSF